MRGGSWNNNPQNVRVSDRNRNEPTNRNNNIGFRCAGYAEPGPRGKLACGPEPDHPWMIRACHLRFRALIPTSPPFRRTSNSKANPGFLVASEANVNPGHAVLGLC